MNDWWDGFFVEYYSAVAACDPDNTIGAQRKYVDFFQLLLNKT
jgi:hypothetical protein